VKPSRALWFLAALSAATAAHADLAPPPGQTERCTLALQLKEGEICVSCNTYLAEADACQKQHAPRGFAFRCRTRGASTWSELWCKSSTGPNVSSLSDPVDGGAEDSSAPAPATSSAPAPTSDHASPSSSTAAGGHSPSPITSASPAPPASPEKSGSCGACAVGQKTDGAASFTGAWLALVAAAARRRRR
jgi:MYXO-CTERM domain-containing protein